MYRCPGGRNASLFGQQPGPRRRSPRGQARVAVDDLVGRAVLIPVDDREIDLAIAGVVELEQVGLAVTVRVDGPQVGLAVVVGVGGDELHPLVAARLGVVVGHCSSFWCRFGRRGGSRRPWVWRTWKG